MNEPNSVSTSWGSNRSQRGIPMHDHDPPAFAARE